MSTPPDFRSLEDYTNGECWSREHVEITEFKMMHGQPVIDPVPMHVRLNQRLPSDLNVVATDNTVADFGAVQDFIQRMARGVEELAESIDMEHQQKQEDRYIKMYSLITTLSNGTSRMADSVKRLLNSADKCLFDKTNLEQKLEICMQERDKLKEDVHRLNQENVHLRETVLRRMDDVVKTMKVIHPPPTFETNQMPPLKKLKPAPPTPAPPPPTPAAKKKKKNNLLRQKMLEIQREKNMSPKQ